jgi:hypothetical protein
MAARARTLPSVISSLLARGLRAEADLALRAADAIDPPSSGVTLFFGPLDGAAVMAAVIAEEYGRASRG